MLQKAELMRVFNLIDKQKKGYVPGIDLELLLLALNINMTPSEINAVLCILPRDFLAPEAHRIYWGCTFFSDCVCTADDIG